MWASQSSIKENASSLKKFYQYMLEKGFTEQQDLDELKLTIKEEMPEWLATVRRYDDPDIEDMEEVWGFK
jgi:site-specific recombinase XerD